MDDSRLIAGGRAVPDSLDRIRRYCGLPWSGGTAPETWAWAYYDEVPTPHDCTVRPMDVLAAAALHPGLSRTDLGFFVQRGPELSAWLSGLEPDVDLHLADDRTLDHLATAVDFEPEVSITLLSKVLHRKRPRLIPLLDRHIVDWYRPLTGERSPSRAWRPVLEAMRHDTDPGQASGLESGLSDVQAAFGPDVTGPAFRDISLLRAIDIAIWMGSR